MANFTRKSTADFKDHPQLGCLYEVFGEQKLDFKTENKMSAEDGKATMAKLTKLGKDFRQMPMYQFFRETGPLEAFAVVQSQLEVANCNLAVVGVFLFEDEAEAAMRYMVEKATGKPITYSIKKTKITRYQGY